MKIKHIVLILGFTIFAYLPLLANPNLFLNRNNDLQEQFWPMYYYAKKSILLYHEVPLWNSLFLSGMPFITDPQAPIFYIFNIIFLIFPLDEGFIFSILLHIFIGGLGTYILLNNQLKLKRSSLFGAFIFISCLHLASFLEAGHVGLIFAFAWIPHLLNQSLSLIQKPNLKASALFALFASFIFFNHLPTFLITLISILLFFSINYLINLRSRRTLLMIIVANLFVLGLIAISLLPQIWWQPYSTRNILLNKPEIYPIWPSAKELVSSLIISPQSTEKVITLGIFFTITTIIGLFSIRTKFRNILIVVLFFIVLIVSSNLSPLFPILKEINFFILLRVMTRFGVVLLFLSIILSTIALNKMNNVFRIILGILIISELLLINWKYLSTQPQNNSFVSDSVYEYLAKDKEKFRVFCTTGCLSQKKSAIYDLELVEGYNTIQQLNYYRAAWQLTGKFWDYYTLSIPPMGIKIFEKISPDTFHLGLLNTKYIISPYQVDSNGLSLINNLDGFYIYQNKFFSPRVSGGEILAYSPNKIDIKIGNGQNKLVVSEVYSPGWSAYVNQIKVPIMEGPFILRTIDLPSNSSQISLTYSPIIFRLSTIISLVTLAIVTIIIAIK